MKLIIVESPTKARTITHYLKSMKVMATIGHIKDLPKNELGVDIQKSFIPNYQFIKGKDKRVSKIVKESKKSEEIFLATDPDREGEAIAYHLQEELPVKAKRVLFYEMTKDGIKKGLSDPGEINMNKVLSQRTRRILDRLVGYKISPLLWKIVRRGLSAGRVQSVILRLICEREEEIRKFIPEDYWIFNGVFEHQKGDFEAELWKIKGKKERVGKKEQVQKIEKELEKLEFRIQKFNMEDRKKSPPPPLITSGLQRVASSNLHFPTKKTMFIAQRLFEGIQLPEGQTGLITYMRTDSFRISKEALESIREFIKDEYSKEFLPKEPNRFKSKKTAQEAHEAIRPTDIKRTPESIKEYLKKDEFKLYKIIWERALASQFKPAIFESRNVIVEGDGYEFKGSSRNLKFLGFYKILHSPKPEKELPIMEVGDPVKLKDLKIDKKTTQPPPRYSEATMVKEMEERGIGRPSTYSPTLSKLFERNYIKKVKEFLVPNEIGEIVNKILTSYFDSIINCKFTSSMEETLDEIEEGGKSWQKSLEKFYTPFIKNLESVEKKVFKIKNSIFEKSDKKCPKCGRTLVVKWGRYGKFLACPGYPENCEGWTEPHPDDILDEECPKCGAKVIVREGKYGRFKSCSNYPNCDWTAPISTGVKCPKCGEGEFIQRKSKKGKSYYPCSNKDCNNVLWDQPIPEKCPECGAPFMVEKKGRGGNYLFCVTCKHKESIK
ncbi:MAG: type I DNA topoisomerase [candidate division WOR-3 bacterium]|nr:type I DNA topoisomerase [candidate division WOR-3 bacterium]